MLNETSLIQLYQSAVAAFPKTAKRQHATDTIVIDHIDWLPFLGTHTLFVKSLAHNEDREYTPIILFKKVKFLTPGEKSERAIKITGTDGLPYMFESISAQLQDVVLRCQCPDFRWRFSFFNHQDKSLYGSKPKKYEHKTNRPPANPLALPGMCKHLMKTVKALSEAGIFTS